MSVNVSQQDYTQEYNYATACLNQVHHLLMEHYELHIHSPTEMSLVQIGFINEDLVHLKRLLERYNGTK